MANAKNEIIKDVKKYIVELNKHGIFVQKAILFGSWTKGYAHEDSDIDVALISEAFTDDRFQDRRRIVPLRRNINTKIEPMPYSPLSFDAGGHLVDEIKHFGEIISIP
ncbi:nucleotidyltransferase domain-containing protein [Desulfonatronovibrio magnus]|uniref:nucleotidyltransferase domain-containing protein n=1 Tax=Desulfonatronovibrio magnus TaxID=698827 RepID=UPI0005EBB60E|nr:nucleotidyltransferase domain-containing protein [Desulfonatronovibrio magnus]